MYKGNLFWISNVSVLQLIIYSIYYIFVVNLIVKSISILKVRRYSKLINIIYICIEKLIGRNNNSKSRYCVYDELG